MTRFNKVEDEISLTMEVDMSDIRLSSQADLPRDQPQNPVGNRKTSTMMPTKVLDVTAEQVRLDFGNFLAE